MAMLGTDERIIMKWKKRRHRCHWKLDDTGYTKEEARILKCKMDLKNGVNIHGQPSRFTESEIIVDPRGGYMIEYEELQ